MFSFWLGRSSGLIFARARPLFLVRRSSEHFLARARIASSARPESSVSWLERASLRSSELLVLRSSEPFLARARIFCVWSLERPGVRSSEPILLKYAAACFRSVFQPLQFQKTLGYEFSLSQLIFFPRIDLVRVCFYPSCFTKKVEESEGFHLI